MERSTPAPRNTMTIAPHAEMNLLERYPTLAAHLVLRAASRDSTMHAATLNHEISKMWISAWSRPRLKRARMRATIASIDNGLINFSSSPAVGSMSAILSLHTTLIQDSSSPELTVALPEYVIAQISKRVPIFSSSAPILLERHGISAGPHPTRP